MKATKISSIVIAALIIVSCRSVKKGTASAVPVRKDYPLTSENPFLFAKTSDGIHIPGNEELTALQAQYSDVTLDKLKEGHAIYTEGACISCHNAKNIYARETAQWKNIIEDMAQRANISDEQKDAVYKYVLSIKATQPR